MHLLFPESPIQRRAPDEFVADQYREFREAGYSTSFVSIEALQAGELRITPTVPESAVVLYRGWMLSQSEYDFLFSGVERLGARMLINTDQYLSAHHLPNWYPLITELTPETVITSPEAVTSDYIAKLGWTRLFIKDYVKSLKTSLGSRITDLSKLPIVINEMRHFRGGIEGGLCLRAIEDFEPNSEIRYFVYAGASFGPNPKADIPEIVLHAATLIQSPVFSIDVARRVDGALRIIEIGDGQVSDLVGWSEKRFVEIFKITNPCSRLPVTISATSAMRAGTDHNRLPKV